MARGVSRERVRGESESESDTTAQNRLKKTGAGFFRQKCLVLTFLKKELS